ncbi:MAG: AGE family epimerase/isomerase [Victivallales bacterium]|jgi:N-acylglucosamine 2-epimerase|nr:AGE family epimerase/isomerase [Victivallales bacterium]
MDFSAYLQRYQSELTDNVIPFWENHCIDHKYGGYFTMLDRDGSVYDTEKYMWMQWRIVYMFATLSMTEYRKDNFIDIAKQGFDFLTRFGKSEDGTYYFALNQRGEPSVAPYNIFSDCFAAMGAAALYRADGGEIYRREAESAMNNYIRRMDNPKGRWEKNLPGRKKRLSLGHYIILANLGNVMKENLNTDQFDEDTDRAIKTVMKKFYNPDLNILFENVNVDGSFDLESCDGRMINPGHGLESMWFVLQYAEKHNDRELIDQAANIIKKLLEFGIDKTYGGIYYFMDALQKPHLELQWDMKLWWPHNEALIATLYAYRLTGDEYFLQKFIEIDQYSFAHFKDPDYPEWFAYLNRRGEATHMLKGGKWKTFFHLPRALFVCAEQMKQLL